MVLAGDSYEMKILCVTEQNYLFFFFFFSFLFFSLLLSPLIPKGVVGTAPAIFVLPILPLSPQDMEEITLPGWSSRCGLTWRAVCSPEGWARGPSWPGFSV